MYEAAYKSYNLAHMWRECFYCAILVPLSEAQLTELAQSLVTTLTDETKDYVSAARIYAEHLHDIPTAARLLCRGSQFGEACRLLAMHGRTSLVEDIVDSALADAMGSMTELLADCRNQLKSQVPRIAELRVRRVADPLGFYGGDPTGAVDGGMDIPDNVSLAPTDASTMAGRSMFTRYSRSTSASRKAGRREERKRAKGKKGTIYEEEYLVNSVRRLVDRVNSAVEEAEVLVRAMLRRGMRERAALVEKNLDELLQMCKDSIKEVFESEPDKSAVPMSSLFPGMEGMPSEPPETRNGEQRDALIVKEFKKLTLLSG
jgi:elongator complex protein 1